MTRHEFLKSIRDAVARRASFICSNPDCRALTIAPADVDAARYLYIGKVAHIAAAAPGGPRHDASMTPEQRRSAANAVFLCSSCADMIDRNGGTDFAPGRLHGWKRQHEAWIRENLNRRLDSPLAIVAGTHEAVGVGEVVGLDIRGAAIIKPGTVSRAIGHGSVTATRIGPRSKE